MLSIVVEPSGVPPHVFFSRARDRVNVLLWFMVYTDYTILNSLLVQILGVEPRISVARRLRVSISSISAYINFHIPHKIIFSFR